uniref:V-type proton ATPase subunit a n=2 Tax=Lygus hesperus TaxID=30085 RepID=A0A0A9YYC6_LYGHE
MGEFFRSEEMSLCQLFIQPEAAYSSVSLLGEAGIVQFRDLNSEVSAFQRKFVPEVRTCEEIERKLRYIQTEMKKDGVTIPELTKMPFAPMPREIIDLEAQVERTENEIQEMSHNAINLQSNFTELTELKHVLEKTDQFFQEQEGDSASRALIGDETQGSRTQLGFVAGVVPKERVFSFERMLWRISRGNVFLRRADIEEPLYDPATGNTRLKTVFVAFFQGEQLKSRVKKVCAGFHATMYPCPYSLNERLSMVNEVKTRLEDLTMVLNQTNDHRQRVLISVARELMSWTVQVRKMKAIYHTMNMFNMDVTKKCLIAECWVPTADLKFINQAMAEGGKQVGSTIPSFINIIHSTEDPPTFNRTNKLTAGFQTLIDSYGISTYREVNPALYTIITFPFLFGIMFGDLGHGFILFLFAAWMVMFEQSLGRKKSTNEIWNIFFGGRYIILLMGLFSMYTGFIYNDIFSKSMNIFGSSWKINYDESTIEGNDFLTLNPNGSDYTQEPYPMGVDPVWQLADNKIIFSNSYKMKLSIIIGVLHMIFGVCLSVANYIHNKQAIYILFDFLPQVLFLLFLFFYMVFMMFFKFFKYSAANPLKSSEQCAPSVLIMFINMVLMSKPVDKTPDIPDDQKCDLWMYEGQDLVQKSLLALALLCIPVMLIAKPVYLISFKKKSHDSPKVETNGTQSASTEMQVINGGTALAEEKVVDEHAQHKLEDEPPVEIIIYQIIHTIEYVLSTVSHTASYLRLWALSLAHGQLSEVLWNMVLQKGIKQQMYVGAVYTYFAFAFWASLTISILVMMEGLSAFLHTLRLHWVEFCSKFYSGLGHPFQPFSMKNILDETEEVTEKAS